MEKHICIKVTGKVQGVGFRYHAQKMANESGIKGFVKNEYDGSVYIEASGKKENVYQFVNWCYNGSKWAMVEDVEITENTTQHFGHFYIK
ncbi:MAG: acylphosphatase [Bacteroidota bacterium]